MQENKDTSSNIETIKLGYADLLDAQLNLRKNETELLAGFGNINAELVKWDTSTSKIIRSLGVGSEYSSLIKKELGEASTEIYRMGGTQEDIVTLQNEYAKTLQRTVILSSENAKELFAITKVTGLGAGELEKAFRNAGMETQHINDEMTTVVETSRSLGVNAQVVSTMVVSNLDKMNRFGFGNGVEGMAKMAAKAASMRVDMNTTLNLADKLFSPEAAIDVASTLQRLGATSSALLDPLKLMDLAQNNVPELQNQLSELSKTFTKFDEKTGKFQIMPEARRQLGEVATALGIDRAEFEKMALESAKIEKKIGEINFKSLGDISEDDKMMLANMAEFSKGKGDYTIKIKEGDNYVEKALNELTKEQINQIKEQQEFEKKDTGLQMVDLAKEQLLTSQQLVAEQKALSSLLSTQFAIGKTGNDFLNQSLITQTETFKNTFEILKVGGVNAEKVLESFQGEVNKIIKTGELPSLDELQNIIKDILNISTEINTETESRVAQGTEVQQYYSDLRLNVEAFKLANQVLDGFSTTIKSSTDGLSNWQTMVATGLPALKLGFEGIQKMFGIEQTQNANPLPQNPQVVTPTPTPLPANNETSQVKEIKHTIELTVKAETNNPEVNTAVLKAFNNDDTLRTLRDKISTIASDYGLTAV